jgi:aldose 1-epimerase
MIPGELRLAGELLEPRSGRTLRLRTNAPGLQVYTGNFLAGVPGKDGTVYKKCHSVCLESQAYPNSVNDDHFPSPWVEAGQVYTHTMAYELFFTRPGETVQ